MIDIIINLSKNLNISKIIKIINIFKWADAEKAFYLYNYELDLIE